MDNTVSERLSPITGSFDNHLAAVESLTLVSDQLRILSTAFFRVGNRMIAEEIAEMAVSIDVTCGHLTKSFNKLNQDWYHQTKDNSGLLLQAVLAGAIIGKQFPEGAAETLMEGGSR